MRYNFYVRRDTGCDVPPVQWDYRGYQLTASQAMEVMRVGRTEWPGMVLRIERQKDGEARHVPIN